MPVTSLAERMASGPAARVWLWGQSNCLRTKFHFPHKSAPTWGGCFSQFPVRTRLWIWLDCRRGRAATAPVTLHAPQVGRVAIQAPKNAQSPILA